MFADHR